MSLHVSTVYWGRCEICQKQSSFKPSMEAVKKWRTNHYRRMHKTLPPKEDVTQVPITPQEISNGISH